MFSQVLLQLYLVPLLLDVLVERHLYLCWCIYIKSLGAKVNYTVYRNIQIVSFVCSVGSLILC